MTRRDDAGPCPASAPGMLRSRLLALLDAGDLDGALQAGLMQYLPTGSVADAPLRAAQEQLRTAWAARERHRRRSERLARQACERDARRAAADVATRASPTAPASAAGALPPAAALALALARARAKAAGQDPR